MCDLHLHTGYETGMVSSFISVRKLSSRIGPGLVFNGAGRTGLY